MRVFFSTKLWNPDCGLVLKNFLDLTAKMSDTECIDLTDQSQTSSSAKVGSRKTHSPVFEYFTYLDNKYKCKKCSKSYAKNKTGTTANLWRHLKTDHPSLSEANKPNQLASFLKQPYSEEAFHQRIITHIIMNDLPFIIVEDPSFRAMFQLFKSDVKFMSADTVRNKIDRMYEQKLVDMIEYFANFDGRISVVLDCWSSLTKASFQGVIACWIDNQYKLHHRVLDLDILSGTHTGVNLSNSFLTIGEKFGILNKILGITTDNASNCDTFFAELSDQLKQKGIPFTEASQRVRCLAHIINLACQDALALLKGRLDPVLTYTDEDQESDDEEEGDETIEIEENSVPTGLFSKIRKAVVSLRYSHIKREYFNKQCEVTGVKKLKLKLDVKTRWNSSYFMLKRASVLRQPLQNTMMNFKGLRCCLLTEDEWDKVNQMIFFLKPFKKMTAFLSNEQIPSMSLSVMVYIELYKHLEKYKVSSSSNSALMVEAAKLACSKLNKYYPNSDGAAFVIGTILDPRCKLDWYSCHQESFTPALVKSYKRIIRSEWERNYKPAPTVVDQLEAASSDVAGKPKPSDLFQTQMKRAKYDKRDELQIYLDEKAIPSTSPAMKDGLLEYWKNQESQYPSVAKMARDFLAISGTGVPVERLFSVGSHLLSSPQRRNMAALTIKKSMCLKSWIKFATDEEYISFLSNNIKDKMLGNLTCNY